LLAELYKSKDISVWFVHCMVNAQSSYGNPLSRVAARLAEPSGLYGSLGGAAEASIGFL